VRENLSRDTHAEVYKIKSTYLLLVLAARKASFDKTTDKNCDAKIPFDIEKQHYCYITKLCVTKLVLFTVIKISVHTNETAPCTSMAFNTVTEQQRFQPVGNISQHFSTNDKLCQKTVAP